MAEYTSKQIQRWLEELRDGALNLQEDNMGLADATQILLGMDVPMPALLPPGNLTTHFTLAEMTRSDTATARGIDNTPNQHEIDELTRTCGVLEKIRALLGDRPITITSAFRSEALNKAVGGVPNSAHRLGLAADFICPSFGSPTEICNALINDIHGLGLDQLINEKTGGHEWVHIGLSDSPPRYQALTITDSGTQVGIV